MHLLSVSPDHPEDPARALLLAVIWRALADVHLWKVNCKSEAFCWRQYPTMEMQRAGFSDAEIELSDFFYGDDFAAICENLGINPARILARLGLPLQPRASKPRVYTRRDLRMYSLGRRCTVCGVQITNNGVSGLCKTCVGLRRERIKRQARIVQTVSI